MNYILDGFKEALNLLISLDSEVYGVVFLSLFVSGMATVISSLYSIPLGLYLGMKKFRGKNQVSRLIYTFMSIPSVIVGLLIAIIFARSGPLGSFKLMYTPTIMIIAQTVLLTPLQIGLSYNLARSEGDVIKKTCLTLGGRDRNIISLLITELKSHHLVNIIAGFSRAISEVGAVMIVGGNIKGHTRVMTTSITMFNSMGEYPMAIALGIVLLLISFIVNGTVYKYSVEE